MKKQLISNNFFKVVSVGIVGAIIAHANISYAGGFQLLESSVKSLGNAFAGTAAVAQDASTEYYNPAGMTMLDHAEISIAGTVVDLNTDA